MRLIILLMILIINNSAIASNHKIDVELIHQDSIKISKMNKSEEGYSYVFNLKMKIYHQLDYDLELMTIRDSETTSAITVYWLDGYDIKNNKLMSWLPIQDYFDSNSFLLKSSTPLTIQLARINKIEFPGVGKYKLIGKFIFHDILGNKYSVQSKPFYLKIIK